MTMNTIKKIILLLFIVFTISGCQQLLLFENSIVLDETNNRVILFGELDYVDGGNGKTTRNYNLDQIDLNTKQRSTISTISSESTIKPHTIVFDSVTNSNIYFVSDDTSKDVVYSFDLNTNQKKVISSASVGAGRIWKHIGSIENLLFDPANNRLLVLAHFSTSPDRAIISVDISNGDRQLIAAIEREEPNVDPIGASLEIDVSNNKIYLLGWENMSRIDPNTGATEIISSSMKGSGPMIFGHKFNHFSENRQIFGIELDINNNRMFALDGRDTIYSIDITTGDRSILSSPSVGNGPSLCLPLGMVNDPLNSSIYVTNGFPPSHLFIVDSNTGDRTDHNTIDCNLVIATSRVARSLGNMLYGLLILSTEALLPKGL